MDNFFDDASYIDVYKRSDALRDGVLVDISHLATGVKVPVAISEALHSTIQKSIKSGVTDFVGIVSDVITCFKLAARRCNGSQLEFKVGIWDTATNEVVTHELKAIIGPGDTESPVITISLPDED